MITLKLTDSTGTLTLQLPTPPLATVIVEGATDVQTLDNNISTYFTQNRRQWAQKWDFMSEDKFNSLKGYYDRQWTNFEYPLLTIDHFNIFDVPVRMALGEQDTIDNCGTVQDVSATFRETTQIGSS